MALYDAGVRGGPLVRAARLVALVLPEADVAALSLGDRDRALWAFRDRVFGGGVSERFDCAGCGAPIGFDLGVDFALPPAATPECTVIWGGQEHRLRLPVCADLEAASGGFPLIRLNEAAPWSDMGFRAAAAEAIEAADPAIDMRVEVACEDCGHCTPRGLDVVELLWRDVEGAVTRIMGDVVRLARAFGWTEAECLALSPQRRAFYIGALS